MIDLKKFEWRWWSQHGEDGILREIVKNIKLSNEPPIFLEIGAHFHEANCLRLHWHEKWRGFYFDDFHEFHPWGFYKMWITKDNIVDILKPAYPINFDLFSLDIDGNDFYVLHSILKTFVPKILVIEMNHSISCNEDKVIPYNENFRWDGSTFYGASGLAYQKLCKKYGYKLLYIENTGTNMFFLHENEFEFLKDDFLNVDDLEFHFNRANNKGEHGIDTLNRQFISFNDAILI